MDISLGSLIQLHVFPTGRRLWAMQQIERRAAERGFPELASHAARAAEHDRVTRQIDARWAARQRRSPAMISKRSCSRLRTTTGCTMPC